MDNMRWVSSGRLESMPPHSQTDGRTGEEQPRRVETTAREEYAARDGQSGCRAIDDRHPAEFPGDGCQQGQRSDVDPVEEGARRPGAADARQQLSDERHEDEGR